MESAARRVTLGMIRSWARVEIMETIRIIPGACVRDVARIVGLDESTVSYHVRILAREGRVVQERVGRAVANYPAGWGNAPERRLAALGYDARVIARVVHHAERPLRMHEVAKRADLRERRTRCVLETLSRHGLLKKTAHGFAAGVLA